MDFQNTYAEDENQNHNDQDHSYQEADRLAAMNPSGRVDIGEQEHFEGGRLKCTGDMCVLEDNDSTPTAAQTAPTKSDTPPTPTGTPYLTYLLYLVLLLVIIAIGYFGYKRFICKE